MELALLAAHVRAKDNSNASVASPTSLGCSRATQLLQECHIIVL